MKISNKRLSYFIQLHRSKTGETLTKTEALNKAETLLRTVFLLYKPIDITDYCSALARKMISKQKEGKIVTKQKL